MLEDMIAGEACARLEKMILKLMPPDVSRVWIYVDAPFIEEIRVTLHIRYLDPSTLKFVDASSHIYILEHLGREYAKILLMERIEDAIGYMNDIHKRHDWMMRIRMR